MSSSGNETIGKNWIAWIGAWSGFAGFTEILSLNPNSPLWQGRYSGIHAAPSFPGSIAKPYLLYCKEYKKYFKTYDFGDPDPSPRTWTHLSVLSFWRIYQQAG